MNARNASLLCAIVIFGLVCLPSQALIVYQLNDAGQWNLYDPGIGAWTITTDVYGAANTSVTDNGSGNYEVQLATGNWGALEADSQNQAIFGAGLLLPAAPGYRVVFDAALYTWDSYDNVAPAGEVYRGYWDVFAVNLNQSDYYWNLMNGGGGLLSDPVVSPDPAGGAINTNLSGTSLLPGQTWAWGGVNYANAGFESFVGNGTLELTSFSNLAPYYLSVTLDTFSSPETDTAYPSYGAFNPLGQVPEPGSVVPEPNSMILVAFGLAFIAARKYGKTFAGVRTRHVSH